MAPDRPDALDHETAAATLMQLATALFPALPASLSVTWPASAEGGDRERAEGGASRLRAAELRYRTLIEQIPAVTFMASLGEDDHEIYISPHIETLLGFSQREWLEDPILWYQQLHPEDRDVLHREFARGCQTGGPFRAECRLLTRDGRVVWVRGEARLVKDELGRPLFLQGVAFDITDSKKAEAVLLRETVRTTEEPYRNLVERLGAIFWEADATRPGFTFVSRGAEQVLGFPPESWLEDPDFLLTRVQEDDRALVAASFGVARQLHQDSEECEFRAIGADGRTRWLHQKITPHRLPDGTARLLGVVIDITSQKAVEEILRAHADRLRLETDIRRTIHRIGSALAGELDIERVVQLATDEATRLTRAEFGAFFYNVTNERGESYMLYTLSGASREAFSQFPLPRNTPIFHPTFSGQGVVRCDDVLRDPRYGLVPPHYGQPPGHLPVRSYLAVPVVSRAGTVLGGLFFGHSEVGVFTEEHEQLATGIAGWTALAIDNARLYQTAEHARQEAEAANRAKDEFLATMSHELRTPLNAVLGWATILGTSDNEQTRRRASEVIERNARAQAQIIDDLLDVSRIVTGKLALDDAPVDIAAVVDASVDAVRLAADAKHITVRCQYDHAAATVCGDAARLRQVISNLLTNAVKFTPAGGRIDVRLEAAGPMVRIVVADTGEGIAPEFLPYVFDRFRQADSSSTRIHGGLGLGLAIVRHLTELHGGRVGADSAGAGQGATFTVELPKFDGARNAAGGPADRAAARTGRRLAGLVALVVEDEPDTRDLTADVLQHAGAVVTAVSSVPDALAALDTVSPGAIVTDIGLPGQDGYVLLSRIRAGRLSHVPVVAVTAYARPEDRERAFAAGFNAYLSKPVGPEELVNTLVDLRARTSG